MGWFAAFVVLTLLFPAAAAEVDPVVGRWERHCLDCHGADLRKGDVDLSRFNDPESHLRDRRLWRRVIEVLESGEMPPPKKSRLSREDREAMLGGLRSMLDRVDWKRVRSSGRAVASRLTRQEYEHAVEDLFGVRLDLEDQFPEETEGGSGFANDRAALIMTERHLEAFLRAAEQVAAVAVDHRFAEPVRIRYEVEEGRNVNWQKRPTRHGDAVAGWTLSAALGQKYQAVSRSFDLPRSGEWRVRVRAASTGPGPMAGLWLAADTVNDASREAGVLVTNQSLSVYETRMFLEAGRRELIFGYDFYRPLWLPELPERPQTKLGQSTFHPPPYDRAALLPKGVGRGDLAAHGLVVPESAAALVGELLALVNEGYYPAVLDRLMLNRFHHEKGYLPVFIGGFDYDYTERVLPALDRLAALLGTDRARLLKVWKSHEPPVFQELEKILDRQREAWVRQDRSRKAAVGGVLVDWIELEALGRAASAEGPTLPDGEDGVAAYLGGLLPLALRRPVDWSEQEGFHQVYREERAAGGTHRQGLHRMIVSVLMSPGFLYRLEATAESPGEHVFDPSGMTARMAAFLWSSVPGRLPVVSGRPSDWVDRMLDDRRSLRFVRQFTEQWLDLAGIGRTAEPDKELFRYFSWHLAEDMRAEVAALFGYLLKENRSVFELLDSPVAFVNERLARLYGMEGVQGEELRPVPVSDDRRGGLLGTAAVLTATSLATRTSPVRRGRFVLETLLGVELPPPPAGVPDLGDEAGQSADRSLRESLARHREDPSCAGCHARIDPLGFALEHFDWIGRWREQDPAGSVDASGQLPDGTRLSGLPDLKQYLLRQRRDDFLRALVERLLAYALGRELEYFDEHAVRRIVDAACADQGRVRTLVKAIVDSYPFRHYSVVADQPPGKP